MGLKPHWFHEDSKYPHYDVTDDQRAKAIGMGAQDVDTRTVIRTARRLLAKDSDDSAVKDRS